MSEVFILVIFLVVTSLIVFFHFEAFKNEQKKGRETMLLLQSKIDQEKQVYKDSVLQLKNSKLQKKLSLILLELSEIHFSFSEIFRGL